MNEPLDARSAQAALAQAEALSASGRRRTAWPRWAAAVDAIGTAACVSGFGFAVGQPLEWSNLLIVLAICIPNIVFRFWWRSKVGVLPKPSMADLYINGGVAILEVLAVVIARVYGLFWAPLALFPVMVVIFYLSRRAGRIV